MTIQYINLILRNCGIIKIEKENIEMLDLNSKNFKIKIKNTKETEFKYSGDDVNNIYDMIIKYPNIKSVQIIKDDKQINLSLPYKGNHNNMNVLEKIEYNESNNIMTITIEEREYDI